MSQFITTINSPKQNCVESGSYLFSINIIYLINKFPNKKVYRTIGDQLLRSAISVGTNIVEAKALSPKKIY